MTWSAPIDRTRSTFVVLQTPVTSAPNDLAICTANVPMPPPAPLSAARTMYGTPVNPPDWAGVTGVPYIVRAALNGAGGGIGTFAVQIAKSFGAEVTGVCSTTKVDLVRSIGADHVIDYTQEDFTGGDEHYDVILDNVLNHSLSLLVSRLSPKGTLVPNGGQFHKRWIGGTGVMFIKAPLKSLFVPQRIRSVNEAPSQDDLLALNLDPPTKYSQVSECHSDPVVAVRA